MKNTRKFGVVFYAKDDGGKLTIKDTALVEVTERGKLVRVDYGMDADLFDGIPVIGNVLENKFKETYPNHKDYRDLMSSLGFAGVQGVKSAKAVQALMSLTRLTGTVETNIYNMVVAICTTIDKDIQKDKEYVQKGLIKMLRPYTTEQNVATLKELFTVLDSYWAVYKFGKYEEIYGEIRRTLIEPIDVNDLNHICEIIDSI